MHAIPKGLLLAAALFCGPASALRARGSPRYFGCGFAPPPALECSVVGVADATLAKSSAERSGMIIFEDDGAEIIIYGWIGRMGNQLRALAAGILMAEKLGRTAVRLPGLTNKMVIVDLPSRIAVGGRNDTDFQCEVTDRIRCSNIKDRHWRRVLARYVWPLLTKEAKAACSLDDGFRGLTIHLRSGDLMWNTAHTQSGFAPCAFFSDIIWSGKYSDVRIVTEKDMDHPCIKILSLQHPEVHVTAQSTSIAEDFCTLVRSRNLALGAPLSTFATSAELLSPSLRRLYTPRDCSCTGAAEPGSSTERCYSIQGMGAARTEVAKKGYLESTPRSAVHQRGACALDEVQYK